MPNTFKNELKAIVEHRGRYGKNWTDKDTGILFSMRLTLYKLHLAGFFLNCRYSSEFHEAIKIAHERNEQEFDRMFNEDALLKSVEFLKKKHRKVPDTPDGIIYKLLDMLGDK